jgi:ABC-2 type transport system ATP-binding protein
MLHVDQLSHAFGPVRALDGISFALAQGQVLGLIGPNGAGKSTALAAIAGLLEPERGTVTIDGQAWPAVVRRRHCFFLADGITPWDDQSAASVLDFASQVYGAREAWRYELAPALAITSFVGQRIGELSKGQRKRVLLTLALLVPRGLTLIDEPFDGLDPRQARAFTTLVRARAATGRTFVLSVHSSADAMRTCDTHLLLHEGRVLAGGDMDALRRAAAVAPDAGLDEVFLALT